MASINCFSTLGCPQLSLRQSIELARTHSIPLVEVRTVSGSNDLPATLGEEFGRPENLATFLEGADIAIPVLGSSHRLIGNSFDFEELQTLARWADAAGARFLRVFDGDGDTLDTKTLDTAEARLAQWETIRLAAGLNVELLIETHGVLCADVALAAFCERLPGASILWDTHHTWAAGSALAATREIIGPRLAHFHVKDSVIRDGKPQYVLPGDGEFPVRELANLLQQESTNAALSLEWEKHWHGHIPELELALKCARNWF